MTIHFDDKGKFFTDVVSKEAVPVIIQTETGRVHGKIHIRPDERLKDSINQSEPFFAVTEATIYDLQNNEVFRTDFLAVHRDHIVWLLPEDQLIQA